MSSAFIFDWSGTLCDNFHCFVKVVNLMFTKFNVKKIDEDEIRKNFTIPYMDFWNKYIPDLSIERQKSLYKQFIHQVGEPDVYPGVKEVLDKLSGYNYKLFIVSSDPASKLIPEIQKAGLGNLVAETISNVHEKSESIKSLIKKYHLNKNKSYYVGDTSGDVNEAKLAGVISVGITWGFQDKDELVKSDPDFLIDNIQEILKIIN